MALVSALPPLRRDAATGLGWTPLKMSRTLRGDTYTLSSQSLFPSERAAAAQLLASLLRSSAERSLAPSSGLGPRHAASGTGQSRGWLAHIGWGLVGCAAVSAASVP